MKWFLPLLLFLFSHQGIIAQKTEVFGVITALESGEPIPFANVFFKNTKTGTVSDSLGRYKISSYYASDSLIVRAAEFSPQTKFVKIDLSQEINFQMKPILQTTDEVVFQAPKEKPSTILHKRIVQNKPINNKVKLEAYEYENYNKIQLDLNNLGDKFEDNPIVKNLHLLANYVDSAESGRFLPLIMSETISDFYYRTNPTKKKEVIKASRITGIDNLELNRFLGEMYQDVNVYENYIGIFDKSFISPIADFARGFYTFYLKDSAFIKNQWCYLLSFSPKRKGDLLFEGEMWVHDTTYAVKEWSATVNANVNVNYVNDFYLKQTFEQVEKEIWMLTDDQLFVDLKITKKTKIYGLFGRKRTTKSNFVINKPRPPDFYKTNENVVASDSADLRSTEYWEKNRHIPLSKQETGIEEMLDSLETFSLFRFFKDMTYLAATGFYRMGKIEIGNIKSIIGHNNIEGFRNQLQIRTSNDFSRRIELTGKIAYGYTDQKLKYGGSTRFMLTPKKRGLLSLIYDKDIKQLGLGENAEDIDAAVGSLLRTKPLTRLIFVEKAEAIFEKDVGKSFIITAGAKWESLSKLGETKFRIAKNAVEMTDINEIRTFETSFKIRFAKNEEFITGAFDRLSLGSRYPILSLEGTLGIKGVGGSDYEYQKMELQMEHSPRIGVLGTLNYRIYGGIYFGSAAYPFLKIHEGSQSYWLQSWAHNRMEYFEFISDKYVGAMFEHHFNGLILNYIPLLKKLKWRLVASSRATWGSLSDRQKNTMLLPENTKLFGNVPYVESAIGIENIFKVIRVEAVWRMTHLERGVSPVGIRAKFAFRF